MFLNYHFLMTYPVPLSRFGPFRGRPGLQEPPGVIRITVHRFEATPLHREFSHVLMV